MGVAVDLKKEEFIGQGFSKKEARIKAHEWCQQTNTCRGCSQVVQLDWWSRKQGYCKDCID